MTHVQICRIYHGRSRALDARRIKPGDLIVLALIALCAAAFLVFRGLAPQAPADELFVITQTKAGYRRADPLGTEAAFDVETPADATGEAGVNTVRIEGGRVEVTFSNCSNQVCVEHDPIDAAGEQIVCLPHGLVIEIADNPEGGTPLS